MPVAPSARPSASGRLPLSRLTILRTEVLAGFTVGIAQVPEAVAFSFAASVPPVHGLYSSWLVGMVTAILGARPAQISGTAGSLVVVMGPLMRSHGLGYILYAVILSGLIQIAFGLLGLGRFTTLIPRAVMSGFCNGLGVLIGLAQLDNFRHSAGIAAPGGPWVTGATAGVMTVYVLLTMAIMHRLPRYFKLLPASLVSIIVCTAIEHGIVRPSGASTILIRDMAVVSGNVPTLAWLQAGVMPRLTHSVVATVAPLASVLAAISLVETLLTKNLIDGMVKNPDPPLSNNREAISMGTLWNLVMFLVSVVCVVG